MTRHEVDNLRRNLFRRTDQIALIFAIFVVDNDDHFAVAYVVDGFLYGCKSHAKILRRYSGRALVGHVNRKGRIDETGGKSGYLEQDGKGGLPTLTLESRPNFHSPQALAWGE